MKQFKKGITVVSVLDFPSVGLYEQHVIKEIHPKACSCGGDSLILEGTSSVGLCAEGFVSAIDILAISKDLKLSVEDFIA